MLDPSREMKPEDATRDHGSAAKHLAAEWRSRQYEEGDLSTNPIFAGGFINFGYWSGIDISKTLTIDERIQSQTNMYIRVAEELGMQPSHQVLEVGCGRGLGATLLLNTYYPAALHAIDASPQQVERARASNHDALQQFSSRLFFEVGKAEDLPYQSGSFDVLYSVEAAQHFDDMKAFARQMWRVLRPGGRFALVTFFLTEEAAREDLNQMIITFGEGADRSVAIDTFVDDLSTVGFHDVQKQSIGEQVWHGFEHWVSQATPNQGRNWIKAYQSGLLDYYLITAIR